MTKVNWISVVVADIVFFLVGGIWYSLLFKNQWIAATGIHADRAMNGSTGSPLYPFVVVLIAGFCSAYALARMLAWRGNVSIASGALVGASMALLIFAAPTWMTYVFQMRGIPLGFIDAGFITVAMAIQGAIVAAWPPKT